MLYKFERDDDLGVVKIIETPTNQVIEMFILSSESQMNEAKALLKHLNMGGAFDGNTPAFFLK